MQSRRRQILCLCNDISMLQVRQMLLEHFGYSVIPASSVEDARSIATERCPDMLLMDHNDASPEFEELAAQVKSVCPDVITVMLSPFYYVSRDGDSIDRVVSKDDGPDTLLSQIEELFGEEGELKQRTARPV
jgi:CheY-like chemotaxis protein